MKMLKGLIPLLLYVFRRAFIKLKLLKGPTPHTFFLNEYNIKYKFSLSNFSSHV